MTQTFKFIVLKHLNQQLFLVFGCLLLCKWCNIAADLKLF